MTWIRTPNDIDTFETQVLLYVDKLNTQKNNKNKQERRKKRLLLNATECTTQKDKQGNGGKMRIWKSNINSCFYIKILRILCYILMVMRYTVREGMAAKSLKGKENRCLFPQRKVVL